ncbi:MAG: decarboxylase [Defluviitaleaceae bacterium]|nr:decarboxylase [Defluviitaleaceae bacterium]
MYKNISNYLEKEIYPFHMPGHKRNADFFPPHLHLLDLTEIPNMDVLSEPTGIIKSFQEKIANFFGTEESFFLVNGSSAGIVAAMCGISENRPLFAARNSHISLYNGLVLSGAMPAYFLPEIMSDGLAGGVSPCVFDDLPQRAAVFIVSPTYEGFVSNIAAIAKKVHARDGILIVDEAHGAHFPFHEKFPKSALQSGADIVINSLHKTLPAVSGCALLHVNTTRVDLSRLRFFVNAVQTTSPSYMLMASCNFMLEKLWNEPDLFEKYVTRLGKIREELAACEESLQLSGRERIGKNAIFDIDEGKFLFSAAGKAEEISEIMADKYKIQFEMAKGRHLLAMTSVADSEKGFARLKNAILRYNAEYTTTCADSHDTLSYALPEIVLTPREAMQSETEIIPSEKAIGRISAEIIAEYPPGIAKIAPGERIRERFNKPFVRIVRDFKKT